MGEIGFNRHEYLYDLDYCDILLISRGYFRRTREMWSAIRWQTYNLMCVSMTDLNKAGIYKPTDLLQFPWENDREEYSGEKLTKEDIEEMRRIMREENERAELHNKEQ